MLTPRHLQAEETVISVTVRPWITVYFSWHDLSGSTHAPFLKYQLASLSCLTSFSKSRIRCCSGESCLLLEPVGLVSRIHLSNVEYRKPRVHAGTPSVITANTLDRQFNPAHPNRLCVTDITYIRTHEGWLYLAVVIDLFSTPCGWLVYEIKNDYRSSFRCIIDGFCGEENQRTKS